MEEKETKTKVKEKNPIDEIKKLNIFEKMNLITSEIGVIEKNLKIEVTKTRSYKAVSERDVLDGIKPLENKYRVYSYPVDREIISTDTLTKETEYNEKKTTTNSLFMRIKTTYRFVNIDKPTDFIETIVWGDGIDTGDKAPGKAMTYADKYALMKAYKLSTGDDPDKEGNPENEYNIKERGKLLYELQKLVIDTGTDYEKLKEHYEVKSDGDMTVEQLKEAIAVLKKRVK